MNVETELRTIMAAHGGLLDPADVVEAARAPTSALHSYFTWDNREAADKWRLEEARSLIRSVTITIEGAEPMQIRAFVSLPADRVRGDGYRLMEEVCNSDLMRAQFIADLHATAERFENTARVIGVAFSGKSLRAAAKRAAKPKGKGT